MSEDIRQSFLYGKFLEQLGWKIVKIGKGQAFVKKIPFLGTLIKIQRIQPFPSEKEIEEISKKYQAFKVILEPATLPNKIPEGFRLLKEPFLPTKTLVLNLKQPLEKIFSLFSKNKKRDIRLAENRNMAISEGTVEEFYQLKKRSLLRKRILPLGTKREIFLICQAFGKKAKILIAKDSQEKPIAGVMILFWKKKAYYWQAASTPEGNRVLAPTLLLWEAIKLAKEKKMEEFDFEGVYDERFPQFKSWLGFSKFKSGFGGKEIIFPLPLTKNFLKERFKEYWKNFNLSFKVRFFNF